MKNATFKTRNMNIKTQNRVSYKMEIYESVVLDLGIGMLAAIYQNSLESVRYCKWQLVRQERCIYLNIDI